MPTIGFNVEQVVYKNLNFSVWDLGGQTNIRPYWRCYYNNTNAIIYVVDSADRERMALARKELFAMFQEEELAGVHLLVFANKQDQRGAMTEVEVARELGLSSIRDRKWHICKASAIKGEGLSEGLDWLADTISGTAAAPGDSLSATDMKEAGGFGDLNQAAASGAGAAAATAQTGAVAAAGAQGLATDAAGGAAPLVNGADAGAAAGGDR